MRRRHDLISFLMLLLLALKTIIEIKPWPAEYAPLWRDAIVGEVEITYRTELSDGASCVVLIFL